MLQNGLLAFLSVAVQHGLTLKNSVLVQRLLSGIDSLGTVSRHHSKDTQNTDRGALTNPPMLIYK